MGAKTARRLVILVVTILVVSLSIFLIQRSQVSRMNRSVLDRAAQAEKDGKFEDAQRLYGEHLEIAPDDQDAQLKFADVLLKGVKNVNHQNLAAQIYDQLLTRSPGHADIRRRLAKLNFEMGHYREARLHLDILLKRAPTDGELHFMLGRCLEDLGDASNTARAVASYEAAIANGALQRLEAYQRRASLLRSPLLNRPKEAEQVIDEMVRSDPGNDRVYLERARYRNRFAKTPDDKKAVIDDLQRVLKQSPKEPEVYLELAQTMGNAQEARQVLEDGLKAVPDASSLHQALAMIEIRSGLIDKAIARLRESLELLPDDVSLHWMLANLLAEKGATDQGATAELRTQIDELRRLNWFPVLIEFLEAYQQANSNDWQKACQTLIRLQTALDSDPNLKSRLNKLLARCYEHLGDRDRQSDAIRRWADTNPQDMQAQMGLAWNMVLRGELGQAIEKYRKLADQVPQARSQLVHLLIVRNQQQSLVQRDWTEVESLIKKTKDSGSSEWVLLKTDLLLAQDKTTEAETLLAEERARSPQALELRIKSAEILKRQRKYSEAEALLDEANKIGDTVNLRLARAQLLIAQGAADLPKTLGALAGNTSAFSPADRRRLLESLAEDMRRLNDLNLAKKLLLEVVELDRNDLEPRLRLLDLAFQAKDRDDIKSQLEQIKKIDGGDGPTGRYQEIRFDLWQAEQLTTTEESEKKALCSRARLKITELSSRRPDWPQIPLALAMLDEQELAQPDLDVETRKSKLNEAANHYLRAIELGDRRLEIIRRATDRLYDAGRPADVTQLWNQLPTATLMGNSLQQQVTAEAVRKGDYDRALELARKAVAANPGDFRERLWLVQVLLAGQRPDRLDEAEAELRGAINAVRANPDPDRWMILVQFLAQTNQMDKAEQAVRDAEVVLKDKSPIGLGRCCEALALAYKETGQAAQKTKIWYDAATQWYRAAQNAKPDDPAPNHQLVEYLLRSGQFENVVSQLESILDKNHPKDPKSTDEVTWARRTLALTLLMNDNDYQQRRKALKVLEPVVKAVDGQEAADGTAGKPDDLRVLAKVYEAQGIKAYHEKARKILEELANAHAVVPEDRFLLAQIYNKDGKWTKAREQYRALLAETEYSQDLNVIGRRPEYLVQFVSDLLSQYESEHDQQELSDAEELIEKLKPLKSLRYGTSILALEARIYKVHNQIEKAVKLIQDAARPNLPDRTQLILTKLAEELGQFDLAEQLLRQLMARSERVQNHLALATFLSRRGRAKEAFDECERLWKGTTNPEELVQTILDVVVSSGGKRDPSQLERAAGWIQKGLEQTPTSSILMIALAELRERQGHFQEAEALYRQDIDQGHDEVVALNNLAWLLALRNEKGNGALDLINRAIARRGPIAELLDTRGVVCMKMGDSQHAIEDLERATNLDPTGPKYFHLAQAYLQAGDKTAAAQNLAKTQAKGLEPDLLHPLERTAYQQVLTELGKK